MIAPDGINELLLKIWILMNWGVLNFEKRDQILLLIKGWFSMSQDISGNKPLQNFIHRIWEDKDLTKKLERATIQRRKNDLAHQVTYEGATYVFDDPVPNLYPRLGF